MKKVAFFVISLVTAVFILTAEVMPVFAAEDENAGISTCATCPHLFYYVDSYDYSQYVDDDDHAVYHVYMKKCNNINCDLIIEENVEFLRYEGHSYDVTCTEDHTGPYRKHARVYKYICTECGHSYTERVNSGCTEESCFVVL